ncbi:hypothetical protein A33M_1833 [Rhodovulum sp. PH10]|nr:hypothetical protein A33M_1833 [Rhodovulum sp. PH10]
MTETAVRETGHVSFLRRKIFGFLLRRRRESARGARITSRTAPKLLFYA